MKKLLIYAITFLAISCSKKQPEKVYIVNSENEANAIKDNSDEYQLYNSDSVQIGYTFNDFKYVINTKIGKSLKSYDLYKLKIPTKTANELEWVNKNYACMMTWWSQSQSRHIFIPTNSKLKFIYIDKNIEETDSVNNNIVYVDTVLYKKELVVFKIENLLTRKTKMLELKYGKENEVYPFYDSIFLTKNYVQIKSARESKKINISNINNGS